MLIFSSVSLFSFTIYILLGIYIFYIKPYSSLNRNFFYFCMCFAVWSLTTFCRAYNSCLDNNIIVIKIQYTAAVIYSVFILRFFILLTGIPLSGVKKKTLFILIWIVPSVFLYQNFRYNSIFSSFPAGGWYIGLHLLANINNLTSIILLLVWSSRSESNRVKKQVKIIVPSSIITVFVTLAGDYIAGFSGVPTPTPSLILIWISAIYFVIRRYRMIEISPYTVPVEIMNSLDEVIALFNPEKKLIWQNETDDAFFGTVLAERKNLITLFSDSFNSVSNINELNNPGEIVSVFRHPYSLHNQICLYDIVIKKVYDSFGDNIGYLLKAKKVKSVEFISSIYRITKRELEIIKLLITGLTYNDIAAQLNITGNTLKTHISSFYNKLGINNKVELINLVNNLEKL